MGKTGDENSVVLITSIQTTWDQQAAQQAASQAKQFANEVARVDSDVQAAAVRASAAREPDSASQVKQRVDAKRLEVAALQQEAAARRDVASAAKMQGQNELDELRSASGRSGNRYDKLTDNFAAGDSGEEAQVGGGGGGNPAGALRTLGQIIPGDAGRIARMAGEFARLDRQLGSMGDGAVAAEGGITELAAGLGPLAAAGIALSAAFALFKRQLDEAQKSLDEATQRQVNYYQTIETSTSDQIKAQLKTKEAEHDSYVRAQKDIDGAVDRLDGFGKAVVAFLGIIGQGPVKESNDLANKASKSAADIGTFNTALGSSEVAANDAAAAQKKLTDETQKSAEAATKAAEAQQKALLSAGIDGQLKYFEIIATGTKESVQKALEQAEIQKKVAEQELSYLKAQLAGASGDQADALNSKIKQLEQTLARDTSEVNSYTRALSSQSVAANDAAAAVKKLDDLYKGITDKQKSFNDASLKIEQTREKDLLSLQQREAQSEEDRLRQEGRDKARAARQQAFDRQKSAADLDFAAMADAADQRAFDTQEAKIKAQEEGEDRQIQHAREIASIDQRVADARIAAAATELDYMRQTVAEFAKLKQGYGDPRYYSDEQIKQVYGAAAGKAGAGYPPLDPSKVHFNPGVRVKGRASGGWLDAGEWSTVNELKGESFDGMMLPNGKGLFYPLQGGNVTHNQGGSLTIAEGAINISGTQDPHAVAAMVQHQIETFWQKIQGGG